MENTANTVNSHSVGHSAASSRNRHRRFRDSEFVVALPPLRGGNHGRSDKLRAAPAPPSWLFNDLAVFTLTVFLVSGCSKEAKVVERPAKDVTENISQQVSNFTLSSMGDDGSASWQVEGEAADVGEDIVKIDNVRVKSQSKDASVTMKAKKGTIKKHEDVGILNEDVVLTYDDGTTVATDTVNWFFKKQIAKTEGPALMNTGSGTTIKCSGPLIMDYKRNVAVFNKKVQIENLKGKMLSEKMVVYFDPARKKVSRVEATGDVCLIRGNSISMSKKAVYFSEEGRAVLTGNPVVYLDSQEARQAGRI